MSLAVVNPRTGEADYGIEPLDGGAIATLAGRLRAAQPGWAAIPPEARGAVLHTVRLPCNVAHRVVHGGHLPLIHGYSDVAGPEQSENI